MLPSDIVMDFRVEGCSFRVAHTILQMFSGFYNCDNYIFIAVAYVDG